MILKYARNHGYALAPDSHLTIGNDYPVLGVTLRPYPFPHEVTVLGDIDGLPRIRGLSLFDVVDPRVPGGWVMHDLGRGFFRLEPGEFERDFWTRFHTGNAKAVELFTEVTGNIRSFHGIQGKARAIGTSRADPRRLLGSASTTSPYDSLAALG